MSFGSSWQRVSLSLSPCRALTSSQSAASCHLVLDEGAAAAEACCVLQAAQRLMLEKYAIEMTTIQVEEKQTESSDCEKCKPIV